MVTMGEVLQVGRTRSHTRGIDQDGAAMNCPLRFQFCDESCYWWLRDGCRYREIIERMESGAGCIRFEKCERLSEIRDQELPITRGTVKLMCARCPDYEVEAPEPLMVIGEAKLK